MDERPTNCYGSSGQPDRSREAGGENPSARSVFRPDRSDGDCPWEKDDPLRGQRV